MSPPINPPATLPREFETDYQPKCKEAWNAPLIGRDMRETNVSWMQPAWGTMHTPVAVRP